MSVLVEAVTHLQSMAGQFDVPQGVEYVARRRGGGFRLSFFYGPGWILLLGCLVGGYFQYRRKNPDKAKAFESRAAQGSAAVARRITQAVESQTNAPAQQNDPRVSRSFPPADQQHSSGDGRGAPGCPPAARSDPHDEYRRQAAAHFNQEAAAPTNRYSVQKPSAHHQAAPPEIPRGQQVSPPQTAQPQQAVSSQPPRIHRAERIQQPPRPPTHPGAAIQSGEDGTAPLYNSTERFPAGLIYRRPAGSDAKPQSPGTVPPRSTVNDDG